MRRPAPATLEALRSGGKPAMAAALAAIEADPQAPDLLALLDAAHAGARAQVIGLTGPPGVGKSTLLSALITAERNRNRSIGAIAVDPSSGRSGGALLGDRIRLAIDPEDAAVFVRSMAARGQLGGLASLTMPAAILMRAVFDLVVIETVGVGQSETAIAAACDTVVFCVQPGAGDSLQFMKAGIAEVPDIAVVTKADLGAPARRTRHDLDAALRTSQAAAAGWSVPIVMVSTSDAVSVGALQDALAAHWRHLQAGGLAERRRAQAERWLQDEVRDAFGRYGLERLSAIEAQLALPANSSPFARLRPILDALRPS